MFVICVDKLNRYVSNITSLGTNRAPTPRSSQYQLWRKHLSGSHWSTAVAAAIAADAENSTTTQPVGEMFTSQTITSCWRTYLICHGCECDNINRLIDNTYRNIVCIVFIKELLKYFTRKCSFGNTDGNLPLDARRSPA